MLNKWRTNASISKKSISQRGLVGFLDLEEAEEGPSNFSYCNT